ncbi:MAG: multinuclear nonheme iron-dependent oxidase, partial [Caldimonas sp.]
MPKLGVGLAYQVPLAPLIAAAGATLDYVEIVPDILWTDLGHGAEPRHIDDVAGRAALERASCGRPLVAHGIGLSIGSAGVFDLGHVDQIERWRRRLGFPWHSDHLA